MGNEIKTFIQKIIYPEAIYPEILSEHIRDNKSEESTNQKTNW